MLLTKVIFIILGRCSESYFDITTEKTTPFDGASFFDGLFGVEFEEGFQFIQIYYQKWNEIVEHEEIPILSSWGFLSSCGGTLGLFLGFSFYGTIVSIIDMIKESGYTKSK